MAESKHRYLNALWRAPVDRTPIWIMRQAGRYLPEYRAVRKNFPNFMDLCRNTEAACEVTMQPLERYDLDAAILFSDILTIPDAMGLGLSFGKGEGPQFAHPLRDVNDIMALTVPDIEAQLHYVFDAVRLIRHTLADRVPLIGFSGSPWTLATYMVEGGSSKTFSLIKRLCYAEPSAASHMLQVLADSVIEYLRLQIEAGAQSVMVFDTWGGVLSDAAYQTFSLAPMQRIVAGLKACHPEIPVTLFTKGGALWLSSLANSGCDALGLDWTKDIGAARQQVGQQVALQGNMDPCVLYAKPKRIREEVQKILQSFGSGSGHIFNLGHGVYPDVPPMHVQVLVEAVHEFSQQYHTDVFSSVQDS